MEESSREIGLVERYKDKEQNKEWIFMKGNGLKVNITEKVTSEWKKGLTKGSLLMVNLMVLEPSLMIHFLIKGLLTLEVQQDQQILFIKLEKNSRQYFKKTRH